jgi:hypothetical protein
MGDFFYRYGYFVGVELDPKAPLVWIVAQASVFTPPQTRC